MAIALLLWLWHWRFCYDYGTSFPAYGYGPGQHICYSYGIGTRSTGYGTNARSKQLAQRTAALVCAAQVYATLCVLRKCVLRFARAFCAIACAALTHVCKNTRVSPAMWDGEPVSLCS